MAGFTDYQRQDLINAQSGAMVLKYTFITQDFAGGADWVEAIRGPTGLRGMLVNVNLFECTEAFADGTGTVKVGIEGGDLNAYGETEVIGTLAVTDAIDLDIADKGVIGTIPIQTNASAQISISGGNLATLTTGQASVCVSIAWFI